ncbi:MAG TPA: NADPH-dependent F420 reductase [Solirubrobacteraceae bacterium]|nr:NADPH-dependent F420 reductase [Solirubrobacteraceae bacterium]
MTDPVSILGATGDLGYGLAVRWTRAGVPVIIGSRDAGRAAEAAERVRVAVPGATVAGHDNAAAAAAAPVVVMSVPFAGAAATYKSVAESLAPGTLVIDATVPLAPAVGGKPTRMVGVWQGSAAQQAAELVPDGVDVVSALHTVSASSLANLDHELGEDVLVCGDRRDPKQAAIALISLIDGLRPLDAGRLELSRVTESLTALMISMNIKHKTHAGIRITGV